MHLLPLYVYVLIQRMYLFLVLFNYHEKLINFDIMLLVPANQYPISYSLDPSQFPVAGFTAPGQSNNFAFSGYYNQFSNNCQFNGNCAQFRNNILTNLTSILDFKFHSNFHANTELSFIQVV